MKKCKEIGCRVRNLLEDEAELLRAIFEFVLECGQAPSIDELGAALGRTENNIIQVLEQLEQKDLILRKEGSQEVISIYPISLKPTEHEVYLEDRERLYAMCALDSFGIPLLFDQAATIVSQCARCTDRINVEVKDDAVVTASHPGLMVWSPRQITPRPAETCCPMVVFFCSPDHFRDWETENPDLAKTGYGESLDLAFAKIGENYRYYGELIGTRSRRSACDD